jgi:hypothetical protein
MIYKKLNFFILLKYDVITMSMLNKFFHQFIKEYGNEICEKILIKAFDTLFFFKFSASAYTPCKTFF